MKTIVRFKDPTAPYVTYHNVDQVGVTVNGIYMLTNAQGEMIASAPAHAVALVECPEKDSTLVVASKLVVG